jgi:thiosulfate/3-mercaptopyruvate sulfurtransferase
MAHADFVPRRSLLAAFIAAGLVAVLGPVAGARANASAADAGPALERQWLVTPEEGRRLVAEGALVLDARAARLKEASPLPGAVPVLWQDFSRGELPEKGRLIEDDAVLTAKLQAVGVSSDRPVVAVADPIKGAGEDGRIVWMLRTLGHPRAVLIDGGLSALLRDGPLTIAAVPTPGDFVIQRTAQWEVGKEEIRQRLGDPNLVVIDAREPREYQGEPGARHIYFKDFLAPDGSVLPQDEIRARLAALGVTDEKDVVAYCTGGIRSGWFTSVLANLGYKVRNYPGSMWEWSASPAEAYPLVVEAKQ